MNPMQKKPTIPQPHQLPNADEVHTYNRMVDALSAYRDTLKDTDAVVVPERFAEPKFVPTCICGNEDPDQLSMFYFQVNWVGIDGYDKKGELLVSQFDDNSWHDPTAPSIREDQVGLFLHCTICSASRKLTPEERDALSW